MTCQILALCGATLLAGLYTPIGDWLVEPLVVPSDYTKSDAIVLLTAWSSGDGVLNDQSVRRTIEAAKLFQQRVAETVVISGRNRSPESGPTARLMADLLISLGVQGDAMILETESTNTHESAVNVARIARARGWNTVTVVSDAAHMRRTLATFRHEALDVRAGADVRLALRTQPGAYRLLQLEATAHEWIGLAYYWWNGWL